AVLGKALGVLGHAELFEPVGNLLHRGPSGLNAIRSGPTGRAAVYRHATGRVFHRPLILGPHWRPKPHTAGRPRRLQARRSDSARPTRRACPLRLPTYIAVPVSRAGSPHEQTRGSPDRRYSRRGSENIGAGPFLHATRCRRRGSRTVNSVK